jgi:hypothetical protein
MPGELICRADAERIAECWNTGTPITTEILGRSLASRLIVLKAVKAVRPRNLRRGHTEYLITEPLFASLVRRGLIQEKVPC